MRLGFRVSEWGLGRRKSPPLRERVVSKGFLRSGALKLKVFFLRNEIESYASSRDDDPNNFTPLIVAKPACFKPNIEQAYYLGSGRT